MSDLLSPTPQPMRCEECSAVWFSRVAGVVVSTTGLGRCAFCGGELVLDVAHVDPAPAVEFGAIEDPGPEPEPEPA